MIRDDKAEHLEESGLYYRAASRWLAVFDQHQSEDAREWLIKRREQCLSKVGDPLADRARRRREYKAMARYAG
ncbi:PerC family transcriptional regulator [Rahnella woolbedingensis]|uniref:PerC family transcriptional regulator n=1 Tax=Rahnella woolbedingensis TaxID=1510574 RepID=UPI003CC6470C